MKKNGNSLRIFVALWAAAIIIHMIDRLHVGIQADQIAVLLMAMIFLLVPNVHSFFWLLVIQLISAFLRMPAMENHWLVVTLVNVVMMSVFGWRYIAAGEIHLSAGNRTRATASETIQPVLRVLVIVVYFFTFFHKLNTGFFDPSNSCAVYFYNLVAQSPHFIPLPIATSDIARHLVIWMVLAFELAIPLLFLFRRTWLPAIIVGVVFHLFASTEMRDFPMAMFALYILFVPEQVVDALYSKAKQWLSPVFKTTIMIFVAIAVFALWSGIDGMRIFGFRLWFALALATLIVCIWQIMRGGMYRITEENRFRFPNKWMIIFPLLLGLNCISPYIGLKTTTALSMFSNLRTENHQTNHLVMPRLPLFGYQDDLVEILETNDPKLQEYIDGHQLVTWQMLKRRVQALAAYGRTDIHVKYVRDGNEMETKNAERDLALMESENILEKRFLEFRAVDKEGNAPCMW